MHIKYYIPRMYWCISNLCTTGHYGAFLQEEWDLLHDLSKCICSVVKKMLFKAFVGEHQTNNSAIFSIQHSSENTELYGKYSTVGHVCNILNH